MRDNRLFENWLQEYQGKGYAKLLPKSLKDRVRTVLDCGGYGCAYKLRDGKVMKVELIEDAHRKQANIDEYFSFLGNFKTDSYPHIAKVYDFGIEGVPYYRKNYAVIYVIMQALYKLTNVVMEVMDDDIIPDLTRAYTSGRKTADQVSRELRIELEDTGYFSELSQKEKKSLLEFFQVYLRFAKKGLIHRDLHSGNIMLDKKGNLVMIDHSSFMKNISADASDR